MKFNSDKEYNEALEEILRLHNLQSPERKRLDLSGANLTGINLAGANLTAANLCYATMTEANLRDADCKKAIFENVNMKEANLDGADLRKAKLDNAIRKGNFLWETGTIGIRFKFNSNRTLKDRTYTMSGKRYKYKGEKLCLVG